MSEASAGLTVPSPHTQFTLLINFSSRIPYFITLTLSCMGVGRYSWKSFLPIETLRVVNVVETTFNDM